MGRETTFAADDAEKLHFIRSRKSALPADTGRVRPCERTSGIKRLLGIKVEPNTETPPEKNLQTVVLYSVCNNELDINAEYIAWQYDCEIEYRESQFSEAVLIGEDREKLCRARDYIYEKLGVGIVTPFRACSIRVGYRKIDFF